MNIGEVLSRAWRIIWRNKVLWLFGILASCAARNGGGGGGGGGNSGFQFNNGDFGNIRPGDVPPWVYDLSRTIEQAAQDGTLWVYISLFVLAIICISCILWVITTAIGSIGQAALVRGAQLGDEGAENLNFGRLWREATPFFWRVFGFNVLVAIASIVLAIVLLPFLLIFGIVFLCLFCIAIPVLIAIGWLIEAWLYFTVIVMVSENTDIWTALGRAWRVLWANIWNVLLMSLVLFIAAFVIGLILVLPFILVLAPAMIGIFTNDATGVTTGLVISGVLLLLYLPIAIVIGGILQAYLWTAWTVIYRRLTGQTAAGLVVTPVEPAPYPSGAVAYPLSEPVVEAPPVVIDEDEPPKDRPEALTE